MPADFKDATTAQVHQFLAKATYDDRFRENLREWEREELADALADSFGIRVDPEDIPPPLRTIPTREQCQKLITMFGLNDEYARSLHDFGSSTLAPLMLVVGYAMPLTATVEREVR
jgi:hypothetical protein